MEPTLGDVSAKKNTQNSAEAEAAREFLKLASDRGLSLTGPDGLLKQFTKNVLETALNEEMTEHLGHEKNRAPGGRESANVRNGSRPKTVLTAATGPVEIEVPRDRDGSFEPVIVKKRQRRLAEVDEVVLSLSARGLTTGEISAHFAQIYGASVSKETISRITDRVVEEMVEWQDRPLEEVYAAVFIDAISRPSVRFVGGASAARRIGGRLAFNRTSFNAGEGALRAIRLASLGCDESPFDVRGAP